MMSSNPCTPCIRHIRIASRPRLAINLSALVAMAFATVLAPAQTAPQPAPTAHKIPTQKQEFEVASIHMIAPLSEDELRRGLGMVPWSVFPTSRFIGHRLSLAMLIGIAYAVDSKYMQGAPNWLDSQEYSVEAKAEGNKELTYEQMQPLLQNLLEQRFHLINHRVTRLTPGFALIVAKNGPKLTRAIEGVAPQTLMLRDGCQAQNIDMAHFAPLLRHKAGGPVVDRTGITGNYDIKLSYAWVNDPSSNFPDLFTAVQEQLGLKLQSQKIPVDYLVIDHVDKIPTEN